MSIEFREPIMSGAFIRDPCPGHTMGKPGSMFRNLINTIIVSQCALASPCDYPMDFGKEISKTDNKTKPDYFEFDFIIVGGGTAGSVLLNRLTEIDSWNVLMIEAGGDPPVSADVPNLYMALQMTCIDWKFLTEEEKGLYHGMNSNKNRWPQGKVLGGSSTLGAMIYHRGTARDYNMWAAMGNQGWSFKEVLPYFKRAEDMRDKEIMSCPEMNKFHGIGGFLSVDSFKSKEPLVQFLMDTAREMGLDVIKDSVGYLQQGYMRAQGNVAEGERMSAAKAYLVPLRKRKNAFILKHSFVTKIIIDPKTKEAHGVEVKIQNENTTRIFKARKEVVISAGTVNTPKILMLSGIGPAEHLRELGIPVFANLRVGWNLQDHPTFVGAMISFNWTVSDDRYGLNSIYEYLTRRTGRFATIQESEVLGFLSTPENDDEFPNLMIFHYMLNRKNTNGLASWARSLNLKSDIVNSYLKLIEELDLLIIQPVLLKPKSVGRIKLRSRNPDDPPMIYPGHFRDSRDVDVMLSALRYIGKLSESSSLRKEFAEIKKLDVFDCAEEMFSTEQYWTCLLSHISTTFHDHVGTAKMGPATDPTAIVGPNLRVYGISNLRIADASIMPTIPGGPTLAPTVMIAEKASDMIKNCWLTCKLNYTQIDLKCKTDSHSSSSQAICETSRKNVQDKTLPRSARDMTEKWISMKQRILNADFKRPTAYGEFLKQSHHDSYSL